jgi:transcription elongation factor Elf1
MKCPECDHEFKIDAKLEQGMLIQCPVCMAELEVSKDNGLKVLELIGENWSDWVQYNRGKIRELKIAQCRFLSPDFFSISFL